LYLLCSAYNYSTYKLYIHYKAWWIGKSPIFDYGKIKIKNARNNMLRGKCTTRTSIPEYSGTHGLISAVAAMSSWLFWEFAPSSMSRFCLYIMTIKVLKIHIRKRHLRWLFWLFWVFAPLSVSRFCLYKMTKQILKMHIRKRHLHKTSLRISAGFCSKSGWLQLVNNCCRQCYGAA
jgi:hypothetical protein